MCSPVRPTLVQHYVYNKFYTKSEVSKTFLLRAMARDGQTDRRGATLNAVHSEGHIISSWVAQVTRSQAVARIADRTASQRLLAGKAV